MFFIYYIILCRELSLLLHVGDNNSNSNSIGKEEATELNVNEDIVEINNNIK